LSGVTQSVEQDDGDRCWTIGGSSVTAHQMVLCVQLFVDAVRSQLQVWALQWNPSLRTPLYNVHPRIQATILTDRTARVMLNPRVNNPSLYRGGGCIDATARGCETFVFDLHNWIQ